jgi:predicted phage tail protein
MASFEVASMAWARRLVVSMPGETIEINDQDLVGNGIAHRTQAVDPGIKTGDRP